MTKEVNPVVGIRDYYFTKYEEVMGFPCYWSGKDFKRYIENLKLVIRMYGVENTTKMIDLLLTTDDDFIANKTDRSPGILLVKANWLAQQALKPKDEGGIGVPL